MGTNLEALLAPTTTISESVVNVLATGDLIPPDQFKSQLQLHLNSADRPGLTHFDKALKNAPNPGLIIRDFGSVGFPLSLRDLDGIKAAGISSTHSKGPWVIPSDWIELSNPAWFLELESMIAAEAAKKLGVDLWSSVKTKLNALVLYESGGHREEVV